MNQLNAYNWLMVGIYGVTITLMVLRTVLSLVVAFDSSMSAAM